jgi:hypothetical protein
MVVVGDEGDGWGGRMFVKRRRSIWTLLGTPHIPRIPFRRNSVRVIPGTILAEFEFCSQFRRNRFINLAGPSAKFDSSGIPGIARILPDSSQNQWRTVKTSKIWATTTEKKTGLQSGSVRFYGFFRSIELNLQTLPCIVLCNRNIRRCAPTCLQS